MRFPPRLGHLATRAVVVAKLSPTFADAHRIDDEEAAERLDRALSGPLLDDLLESTWAALTASSKRLDEAGLLEKIAQALKDRPLRQGKRVVPSPALGAFLVSADLAAGTASDAARRVLDTEEGRKKVREGLAEAGQLLAKELTKK